MGTPPPKIMIDPLSVVPLHLEAEKGGRVVSLGTGFIVTHKGHDYLITNWHVVTGRNPDTGAALSATGADPDTLAVFFHHLSSLGQWVRQRVPLLVHGAPQWKEHPHGRSVDVVALPVSIVPQGKPYPLDLALTQTDLIVSPSEPVSIIGFPYGNSSAGKFPIWKTGHVASDIDLDYAGQPVFLIDATTRPGMSGSPVVARRVGMVRTSTGFSMGGGATKFLGVFSGVIQVESEVGMVWKPHVLTQILP